MSALLAKALRLNTTDANFEEAFQQRLHWSADADAAIESRVADILADVQSAAMRRFWNTPNALMA